jgi:hypothetical protein
MAQKQAQTACLGLASLPAGRHPRATIPAAIFVWQAMESMLTMQSLGASAPSSVLMHMVLIVLAPCPRGPDTIRSR